MVPVKRAKSVRHRRVSTHSSKNTKRVVAKMLKLHHPTRAGTTEEVVIMDADGYGPRLKKLRVRAGYTNVETLSAALGGKSDTTYRNYENHNRYKAGHDGQPLGNPIPGSVILAVAPLIVGRGEPPVGLDELIAISDIPNVRSVLAMDAGKAVPLARPVVLEASPMVFPFLPVRHHLEAAFREQTPTNRRGRADPEEMAPMLPLRTYPQANQWAAKMDDDHGHRHGIPRHSIVSCVDYDFVPPGLLTPGTLIVLRRKHGQMSGVCLAAVAAREGYLLEGRSVTGEPIGVALYHYSPVSALNVVG